jgi:hypothetical protein
MNVPAIAKRTFDKLKNDPPYKAIFEAVVATLKQIPTPRQRAYLIHETVDDFNKEAFSHPLVKELSPCKQGCSACCHTQVSITQDEAELLAHRVQQGIGVDMQKLEIQALAGNDSDAYFDLSFEDRRCVFLDDQGSCRVYEDRPSVCRTNVVLGDANQCDTSNGFSDTRLVLTPKSDMAIYGSFHVSALSGTLPYMLYKTLKSEGK